MNKETEQKRINEFEFKSFNQDVAREELSRKAEEEEKEQDD